MSSELSLRELADVADGAPVEREGIHGVQTLWFAFLHASGSIQKGGQGLEDCKEYGELFEKLFEKGEYRTDFHYGNLVREAFAKMQSFTPEMKWFCSYLKGRFVSYLIGKGVISGEDEFLNGGLNIIFNVSVACELVVLKAFEEPSLNGSRGIDFLAGEEITRVVREEAGRQLVN